MLPLNSLNLRAILSLALLVTRSAGQYVGSVGPTTALAKKTTVCNVLDYGGKADNSTDIASAIVSAFACVKKTAGSRLYIPPGNYLLATSVTLSGGTNWAFQLDGVITASFAGYTAETLAGNMLVSTFIIKGATDFEMYSSNKEGAFQAHGFIWRGITDYTGRSSWPRILRFIKCTDFSAHDLLFADGPSFHVVVNTATNAEIYRMTIRAANLGATDGIDIDGTNLYVHDIEVTNRDECISIKSPMSYATIKRIRCNHSGGMSIGSLTNDAAISNILVQDVEAYKCTNMLMLKTYPNGATPGYVRDILFRNFTGIDNTYTLYLTEYWENSATTSDTSGVRFSNVTFKDWRGSVENGASRGAVVLLGSAPAPAYDLNVINFSFWTENGNKILNKCSNAYGTGACLKADPVSREKRAPSVPTTGDDLGSSTHEARFVRHPKNAKRSCASGWGQCGGASWSGATCCLSGFVCTLQNKWYSQCLSVSGEINAVARISIPTSLATYTTTQTVTAAPTGWTSPVATWGISGFGLNVEIPVPTATFY